MILTIPFLASCIFSSSEDFLWISQIQQGLAIKTAIAVANQPIVGKIVELAEVKSEIAYQNTLNVQEGVFEESSYAGKLVKEYDAVLKNAEVLSEVDALQRRADELQDALDEFNASVKVEIEVD